MRKLASIRKIGDIKPITNADTLELAMVDGWQCVVKKGEFNIGDLVIYIEIDSFLPINPIYEFLRKSCYRKLEDGKEGFLIRTIKLRGCISQGLLLKPELFPQLNSLEIGLDVTSHLGIIKYEKPLSMNLMGKVKGYFPSFIVKTNEERVQNLGSSYEELKDNTYFVTEKLDGTSSTFFYKDGEFGVCSRNLQLEEPLDNEFNTFWYIAKELDLSNKLKSLGRNIAIQGEIIGPGINKNRYKLSKPSLYCFTIFDIDKGVKVCLEEFNDLIKSLNISTVPFISNNFTLPDEIFTLIEYANGYSRIEPKAKREGLVIRNNDMSISFKVISNNYLLSE